MEHKNQTFFVERKLSKGVVFLIFSDLLGKENIYFDQKYCVGVSVERGELGIFSKQKQSKIQYTFPAIQEKWSLRWGVLLMKTKF